MMNLYPSNIIYKNLKFKNVSHKPTIGNTPICGKLPSEPWEAAEWEFPWVGLLSWILWAWQGSQAESVCNQLLWKQAWDHQSVWVQRFPSFPSLSAFSLPPFSRLPTKEASKLLLEIQISIHLATQLRNTSTPLGITTCVHARLKHTMSRIVCSTHVQVHAHPQCSMCAGMHSNRIIRRSCYAIIGCQSSAHKPLCWWKIMRNYHGNPWTSLSSLLIPQNTAWQLQLHLQEHILFESTGQKDWGAVLLSLVGAHLRTCSEYFTAKISFLDFISPPVTRKSKPMSFNRELFPGWL